MDRQNGKKFEGMGLPELLDNARKRGRETDTSTSAAVSSLVYAIELLAAQIIQPRRVVVDAAVREIAESAESDTWLSYLLEAIDYELGVSALEKIYVLLTDRFEKDGR